MEVLIYIAVIWLVCVWGYYWISRKKDTPDTVAACSKCSKVDGVYKWFDGSVLCSKCDSDRMRGV